MQTTEKTIPIIFHFIQCLTQPVFSSCMPKAVLVLIPSSVEVHSTIHSSLEHLVEQTDLNNLKYLVLLTNFIHFMFLSQVTSCFSLFVSCELVKIASFGTNCTWELKFCVANWGNIGPYSRTIGLVQITIRVIHLDLLLYHIIPNFHTTEETSLFLLCTVALSLASVIVESQHFNTQDKMKETFLLTKHLGLGVRIHRSFFVNKNECQDMNICF